MALCGTGTPSANEVSSAQGIGNCMFCAVLLMAAATSWLIRRQGMSGRAEKLETRGQRIARRFLRADASRQGIRTLGPLAIKQLLRNDCISVKNKLLTVAEGQWSLKGAGCEFA